jgi:hypothetical protein
MQASVDERHDRVGAGVTTISDDQHSSGTRKRTGTVKVHDAGRRVEEWLECAAARVDGEQTSAVGCRGKDDTTVIEPCRPRGGETATECRLGDDYRLSTRSPYS